MTQTCAICGLVFEGYGNNPQPLTEGRCCQACDDLFVIPLRIHMAIHNNKHNRLLLNFIQTQVSQVKLRKIANAMTTEAMRSK